MESLVASSFNLLVLVALLVYKLRGPLKDFILQRHLTLKHDIQSVSEQLQQAQQKFNELTLKLKSVQAETAAIRAQTAEDAEQAKKRILAEAQRLSTNVVSDAKNVAEGLYLQMQGQLYFDLSNKVLQRAEKLLRDRLTGDDKARIRKEFSQQMESLQ